MAGRTDERENEKNKKLEEWRDTTELIQFGALPVFDFQKKKEKIRRHGNVALLLSFHCGGDSIKRPR